MRLHQNRTWQYGAALVGGRNVAAAGLCCGKKLNGRIPTGSVSQGVEAIHAANDLEESAVKSST